jgi:hypothetical protein
MCLEVWVISWNTSRDSGWCVCCDVLKCCRSPGCWISECLWASGSIHKDCVYALSCSIISYCGSFVIGKQVAKLTFTANTFSRTAFIIASITITCSSARFRTRGLEMQIDHWSLSHISPFIYTSVSGWWNYAIDTRLCFTAVIFKHTVCSYFTVTSKPTVWSQHAITITPPCLLFRTTERPTSRPQINYLQRDNWREY